MRPITITFHRRTLYTGHFTHWSSTRTSFLAVNRLNEVRDEANSTSSPPQDNSTSPPINSSHESHTSNRVDTTLNDVFQLLSLFFLTIGKSRESPATYCQLSTMKVSMEFPWISTMPPKKYWQQSHQSSILLPDVCHSNSWITWINLECIPRRIWCLFRRD